MKKIIYPIALFTSFLLTEAKAQQTVKQSKAEIANFLVWNNNLIIYTQKEPEGQFIYVEQKDKPETAQKLAVLNGGIVNALIGNNPENQELFVYQQFSRKQSQISIYQWNNSSFQKTGQRELPKLNNQSNNLGMHLMPDKNRLFLSGELGKTAGYDDLYLCTWGKDKWSKPEQLGEQVNTKAAEFAPFVANDTLYFSRKEKAGTFIYATALSETFQPNATAAKFQKKGINENGTYHAYYHKNGKQEVWVSKTANPSNETENYVALLTNEKITEPTLITVSDLVEKPVTPIIDTPATNRVPAAPIVATKAVVPETKPEVAKTVAILPEKVTTLSAKATSTVSLFYNFNEVDMRPSEERKLHRFLASQPEGATIRIKGFSDGAGSDTGKQNVSQKRAALTKAYLEKFYKKKQFNLEMEHDVLPDKGKPFRKVELYILE